MNSWMIICNTQKFDLPMHFENTNKLVWKQPKNIEVGDKILIYLSTPFSAIKYACKVHEINISDKSRILQFYKDKATNVKESDLYMEIELIHTFGNEDLSRKKLLTYNVNCFQRPTKTPEKLLQHVKSILGEE